MIFVNSAKSGTILPAQILKVSPVRKFFGKGHIRLSVVNTTSNGISVTTGWYKDSDVTTDYVQASDYIGELETLLGSMATSIQAGLSLLDKNRVTMVTPRSAVDGLSKSLDEFNRLYVDRSA